MSSYPKTILVIKLNLQFIIHYILLALNILVVLGQSFEIII